MRVRHVQCPVCGAFLNVPPGCANCFVRCGMCHHRFRLPRRIAVTDDAIAEWLWAERRQEDTQEAARASEEAQAAPKRALREAAASGNTAVLSALTERMHLVRADRVGAVLEFPASRLTEKDFRLAMPRRCIRCGVRAHLGPHVVIFMPKMVDSFSLEPKRFPDGLGVRTAGAERLSGDQLLSALPEVPDVAPPANLPMPYWVCDMCTGKGMISGQIRIHPETGAGICRLLIRSLRRAEEFLVAAGGANTHDHSELRRRITAGADNPWDNIPETIQHRIGVWHGPVPGERFVAYMPDRDLSRSEDGMSGIIVTNMRFIYHTQMRHREARIGEALRVQASSASGREHLRIRSPSWEIKRFTTDREGVSRLRRALIQAKFSAIWH